MGRRSQTQKLNIWMNGIPVGCWENTRLGNRLSYFDDQMNRHARCRYHCLFCLGICHIRGRWLQIISTICCPTTIQFAVVWHSVTRQEVLMLSNCWRRLGVTVSVRYNCFQKGRPLRIYTKGRGVEYRGDCATITQYHIDTSTWAT